MNIDYANIIEKANKRKEDLQKFTQLLTLFDSMNNQLNEANVYMVLVKEIMSAIDLEGQSLIPLYAQSCIKTIATLPTTSPNSHGIILGRQGLRHYLVHGTELKVS